MLELGSFLDLEDSTFKGFFLVNLLTMGLISMMSIVT
jgi:hypothetical protein